MGTRRFVRFQGEQRPVCPFCRAGEPVRNGGTADNRQFRCRGCGRFFYERRRARVAETAGQDGVLPGRGCPYCGGACVKRGRAKNGAQRFRCSGCGRMNTGLRATGGNPEGGPFPHRMTLYFDFRSEGRLRAYCLGWGLSLAEGIRRLLRDVAVARFAAGRGGQTTAAEVDLWEARARLADARRESRRARVGVERDMPTVYVSLKVSLALDDLARQGLVPPNYVGYPARALGRSHQAAARWLALRARGPDAPVVGAGVGRRRR